MCVEDQGREVKQRNMNRRSGGTGGECHNHLVLTASIEYEAHISQPHLKGANELDELLAEAAEAAKEDQARQQVSRSPSPCHFCL